MVDGHPHGFLLSTKGFNQFRFILRSGLPLRCYLRALTLLAEHRAVLDKIAQELCEAPNAQNPLAQDHLRGHSWLNVLPIEIHSHSLVAIPKLDSKSCIDLLLKSWGKTMEILLSAGRDPSQSSGNQGYRAKGSGSSVIPLTKCCRGCINHLWERKDGHPE